VNGELFCTHLFCNCLVATLNYLHNCFVNECLVARRRRLSTVLMRLKFAEHLKEAVTYIEQGHIRVGPETVTDPAFLVTRNTEDFVTWVDTSKIKRKVLEYNEKVDDYDAMN